MLSFCTHRSIGVSLHLTCIHVTEMLEVDGNAQNKARDGHQLIELVVGIYQLDRKGQHPN